jgi:hypothetical protein
MALPTDLVGDRGGATKAAKAVGGGEESVTHLEQCMDNLA